MKTFVVVAAGAADRPLEELGGRTPLEAAATPVLDRMACDGRLGRLVPAPKDVRPEEGAFALGLFTRKLDTKDALLGFFSGLVALLFLVEGPIQALLPGEGLTIAWPLYSLVGAAIVVAVGHLTHLFRR